MMFSAFTLALLSTVVSASPLTIAARHNSSSACDGLGPNAFDDTTSGFGFILGVTDGTTVNPQSIVLADPTDETPIKVLGTLNTHPNVPFSTSFELQNGALTPVFSFAGPVAQLVIAGSFVSLAVSPSADPAGIYCAVPQEDENNTTLLAVNGDTDSFALCAESAEHAFNVFSLVYKPDAYHPEYQFKTCRSAKVQVL